MIDSAFSFPSILLSRLAASGNCFGVGSTISDVHRFGRTARLFRSDRSGAHCDRGGNDWRIRRQMGKAITTGVEFDDLLGPRYVTIVLAGEHTIGLALDGRPNDQPRLPKIRAGRLFVKLPNRQNSECPAGVAISDNLSRSAAGQHERCCSGK